MKKLISISLVLVITFILAACGTGNQKQQQNQPDGKTGDTSDIHIGIVTGTVSQGEDELRGAEAFIKEYGDIDNGGIVKHVSLCIYSMVQEDKTRPGYEGCWSGYESIRCGGNKGG